METLSWIPMPNSKAERLQAKSGPHRASLPFTDAVAPARLDFHQRRSGVGDWGPFGNRYQQVATVNSSAMSIEAEVDSMLWDDVVDVVCAGSGVASLASAIIADDAGLDVFVVDGFGSSEATDLAGRMGVDEADCETHRYLAAVSEDIAGFDRPPACTALPVATVAAATGEVDRRVPPFIGRALSVWASSCLASPYGALYTDVVGRNMTTIRTENHGDIEAAVIGALPADSEASDLTLGQYLADEVEKRGIAVQESSPLQSLVFDEYGRVAGIVVATPDGTRAVRAKHGVVLASGGGADSGAVLVRHLVEAGGELCVMSRTASRFAQIGLLTRAE